MERNEISYQFSGCKVSLAWFSKAQESLGYSFTQLRNSYVYSITSTVGMIIGRFERLVAKLIEISLERKKEEGKKGGERERGDICPRIPLSRRSISPKVCRFAQKCADFPRAAFSSSLSPLEPRLPPFYHGEIRVRDRRRAKCLPHAPLRGILKRSLPSPFFASGQRWNHSLVALQRSRKQYPNFSSPRFFSDREHVTALSFLS